MNRRRREKQRATRALLTGTGVVLLAAAIVAMLLATKAIDHIGDVAAHRALLTPAGRRFLHRDELALQIGAVVVGVVLVGLGAVWLRNLIPPLPAQDDVEIENRDPNAAGTNTVRGGALASSLTADLEGHDSIQRARAEFQRESDVILLRLDVDDDAPIDTVLGAVASAVERIRHVAEMTREPTTETTLRFNEPAARRVV